MRPSHLREGSFGESSVTAEGRGSGQVYRSEQGSSMESCERR